MTEPAPSHAEHKRETGHPDVPWTTPSQAEGERDDEQDTGHPDVQRTTPSQAEGERWD